MSFDPFNNPRDMVILLNTLNNAATADATRRQANLTAEQLRLMQEQLKQMQAQQQPQKQPDPCSLCKGKGRIYRCERCKGTGEMKIENSHRIYSSDKVLKNLKPCQTKDCHCGGKDKGCSLCKGTGYNLIYSTFECQDCQGSGIAECYECKGTGVWTRNY